MMIAERILNEIWNVHGAWVQKHVVNDKSNNSGLIREFFFVILGGFGISYEQNMSGLKILEQKGFIDPALYKNTNGITDIVLRLRQEFNERQFEPMTKDGKLRKYRFVETKPSTLTTAGLWLWEECEWNILLKLKTIGSMQSRQWLCECPGIGMKSASWFLRNTGYNDDCAVLDVHVLRFLNRIGLTTPKNMTDKTYLNIEEIMRGICNQIGVSLGTMDYLLWVLGRNGYLAYVG